MNLNDLQHAWNSPHNNLPAPDQQQLAQQFARQMIRHHRFRSIWLATTFVWLTLISAAALRTIAIGNFNPVLEWAVLPLVILPWGLAIHFLRRHLKPAEPTARGEMSVTDSFDAALRSNRTEQSHLKMVAMLLAIMVPLLAVSMRQLHAVGKVSSHELACMAVFFGGALLVSGIGLAARYFVRVMPQQRRLVALLAELNENGRPA